jgi:RimJ/RimL family protein N-acetyltransferase
MAQAVGAIIKDERNRVYVQRHFADGGTWDLVGGRVMPGETPRQALARAIEEQTGWRLRGVEAVAGEWDNRTDYLVEVDGDLASPHPAVGTWVGPDALELVMAGRADGDRRVRDIVARAIRTRLTARLRLVPIGRASAGDLWRVHYDDAIATWYGGRFTPSQVLARAARGDTGWEHDGVEKWLAYDRGTGALIGRGGVSLAFVDGADRYEVGWAVLGAHQGNLYATEIGAAGLEYAFSSCDAPEVVAFTEPRNIRSRAVMDHLGMRYRRDITHHDEPFVLYGLTREEYQASVSAGTA